MQRLWVRPESQRFVELMPLRDVDVMLFAKQNSVLLKGYSIQCTTAINKGAPTGKYGGRTSPKSGLIPNFLHGFLLEEGLRVSIVKYIHGRI